MSLAVVECPECNWAKQVMRRQKRDVYENFPSFEGREMGDAPAVSSRGQFYCPDCNREFSANGQTFNESLMLVKL